jgi:hypothetical protein
MNKTAQNRIEDIKKNGILRLEMLTILKYIVFCSLAMHWSLCGWIDQNGLLCRKREGISCINYV